MPTQIGLQVYTLRNFLRTPAEIATTMAKVKKIGYDAVELAGLGPIEPAELNKILAGEGLICCSTHTAVTAIRGQTQQTIDNHKLWRAQYVIIPSFNANSAQAWIDF